MARVLPKPGRDGCFVVEGVNQNSDTCLNRERAGRQAQAVRAARANSMRGMRSSNRRSR